MIILAVDLGTKRTGFAMCDPQEKMALALPTLMDVTAVDVAALAEERGAGTIIVGLPLNMDGTVGPSAQRALDFIDELKLHVVVPVVPWDERLSTAEGQTHGTTKTTTWSFNSSMNSSARCALGSRGWTARTARSEPTWRPRS